MPSAVDKIIATLDEQGEEEVNEEELTSEEEEEEEEEPQPPKKRRVVGIVKRVPTRNTPREISGGMIPMPSSPAIMQEFYPPQMYGRQQQQKEPTIAQRVRQDIQYQIMYEKELRRAQVANQPREPFNQKLLRVANQAAKGDGAGSKINIKTKLFNTPRVDLPSPTTNRNALKNLDNVIKTIRPTISKNKKKKGFF